MTQARDLQLLIQEIDAQIELEREQLNQSIRASTDRLLALLLRRTRLREVVDGLEPPPSVPASSAGTILSLPRVKKASEAILEVLTVAGAPGMLGPDLNAKMLALGLTSAATDKARTRLKSAGKITLEGGYWKTADFGGRERKPSAEKARRQ